MTDDRRNIDGLVDLVLTRALVMSERQFGRLSLIPYCVTCTDGMCLLSDPVVAALIVQGGHLTADLHLGAVGVGEVLEVQAGHQLPVNLALFFNIISSRTCKLFLAGTRPGAGKVFMFMKNNK